MTVICSQPVVFQKDVNGDSMIDRVAREEKSMSMEEACQKNRTFRSPSAGQPLDGLQARFLCRSAGTEQKQEKNVCAITERVEFAKKDGAYETDPNKVAFLATDGKLVRVGDRVTMQACEGRRIKSGADSYACTGIINSFAVSIMSDGSTIISALLGGAKGFPPNVPADLNDLKKAE